MALGIPPYSICSHSRSASSGQKIWLYLSFQVEDCTDLLLSCFLLFLLVIILKCVKSGGMQWEEDFRPMLLDFPCYQTPIACLTDLLYITESEQVVGHVLSVILTFVVQLPS